MARFDAHADARPGHPALVALGERGEESATLTYGDLRLRALAIASFLEERSVPNDRIVLAFEEPLAFSTALIACGYAGRIGVPVAMPVAGNHDKGRLARIAAVATDCTPALALTSELLVRHVWPFAAERGLALTVAAVESIDAEPIDARDPNENALFYLQYTSGSTGAPRGVCISHGTLTANLLQIERSLGFDPARPFVTWLPHFHDMGLVMMLLMPLAFGTTTYAMSPTAFLKRPARWFEAIGRYGAASTAAPNFALDVCTRRIGPVARDALDISSLSTLVVGAEPIREASLRRFTEAFAGIGFVSTAWALGYGLAEATVFAAVSRSESGFRSLAIPNGSTAISCGRPPEGTLVRIVDPITRELLPDGAIGEVVLAGPSVADRYWSASIDSVTLEEDETKRRYLATGDLGTIIDGELAIVGRLKDVIIVNGVNHQATDIEATVLEASSDLVPSGCAAFGASDNDAERLVVVLEVSRAVAVAHDELLGALRVAIDERHEVMLHDLLVAPPGRLPRTSSGKIRRSAARDAYASGALRRTA